MTHRLHPSYPGRTNFISRVAASEPARATVPAATPRAVTGARLRVGPFCDIGSDLAGPGLCALEPIARWAALNHRPFVASPRGEAPVRHTMKGLGRCPLDSQRPTPPVQVRIAAIESARGAALPDTNHLQRGLPRHRGAGPTGLPRAFTRVGPWARKREQARASFGPIRQGFRGRGGEPEGRGRMGQHLQERKPSARCGGNCVLKAVGPTGGRFRTPYGSSEPRAEQSVLVCPN